MHGVKESVVLRIAVYKRALESAKVNVVGASRSYVIVLYLLPQTYVQLLVCPHVHHILACACARRSCVV